MPTMRTAIMSRSQKISYDLDQRSKSQRRIKALRKLGYEVEFLNSFEHLRIGDVDWWPSTGKWRLGPSSVDFGDCFIEMALSLSPPVTFEHLQKIEGKRSVKQYQST